MFSESEKPWIATDTLPWPPRHLRPYIKQDYTQDWEIVDESIPDDLRKEFEEWYKTKFLEAVKWENERYERQLEQDRYDKIWDERLEALWTHKPFEKMRYGYLNHYDIGFIQPKVDIESLTVEELEEYVEILNEAHKNWLEEVKRQENTPGYLPEDFDQKNLELIRKTFAFDSNVSFHEIIDVVEDDIKTINEYLIQRKNEE